MPLTDDSFTTLVKKRRDITLAIFHRNNPQAKELGAPITTADNTTYLERRVGEMYLNPPSVMTSTSTPVYTITCNDAPAYLSELNPLPTTPYIISPSTPGVGVALFLFVDSNTHILSTVVVNTTQQTLMPIPPAGTALVEYGFRCSPDIIDLGTTPAQTTESWIPYKFQNTFAYPVTVSFTPNTVSSQTLSPAEISTTVSGITAYSTQASFIFASTQNPDTQYGVAGSLNLRITANGKDIGIQFNDTNSTLFAVVSGDTNTIVVPNGATYFTAKPCFIYNVPNPISDGATFAYNGSPFIIKNTNTLTSGQSITIQYKNNTSYLDDAVTFVSGGPQIVYIVAAPPSTNRFEARYQS